MSSLRPLCGFLRAGLSRHLRSSRTLTEMHMGERTRQAFGSITRQTRNARVFSTQNETEVPRGGFSYPGPRKLSEIVKIQLLEKHGSMRVREIWDEYHKDHKSAVGEVLSAEEYALFKHRTGRCKHFVLPVPR